VPVTCHASSRRRMNHAAFAVPVLDSLSATLIALLLSAKFAQHAHLDRSLMPSNRGHMVYAVLTARLTPRPSGARGLPLVVTLCALAP
jgi:hypothetical protein